MKAAANHTAFKVQIGSALASSTASESQRQLLQLRVDLDMDGPSVQLTEASTRSLPPPACSTITSPASSIR